MLAVSIGFYIITSLVSKRVGVAAMVSGLLLARFATLWLVYP